MNPSIIQTIAKELSVRAEQVKATIELLDGGATVPFIARYRKELTGALDDIQLRQLSSRLDYIRQLEQRRGAILSAIEEQGALTDQLAAQINQADNKQRLEDLYLPFKPRRNNKAESAKAAGLGPLAEQILLHPEKSAEDLAAGFLNPDSKIHTTADALEGAAQIIWANLADNATLLETMREWLWKQGVLAARATRGKAEQAAENFRDYLDYREAIHKIPSHRCLALLRGERESLLKLSLQNEPADQHYPLLVISKTCGINDAQLRRNLWLKECLQGAWDKKIQPSLQTELISRLQEQADAEAIRVFSRNLKDLLLAAPAGNRAVIGLDPGLRTGVKVAVLDATGKLLDHTAIYPHAPRNQWDQSIETLATLAKRHQTELVSIGNGTASRETERLVQALCQRYPELSLTSVVVSEAGASIYSASELASQEFPDLDVTIRGAVSIARRLQDPLAELVKIEPKAIGVGQYQHDVNQPLLAKSLDDTVEDCVNHVGVDLNTASAPLLSRVAGLNKQLGENIVAFRNKQGAFRNRQQLLKVKRLGAKTFEQAAAFLRIRNGEQPLDNSAIHPESYPLAETIAQSLHCTTNELLNRGEALQSINAKNFVSDRFGEYTVQDLLKELAKPGRDPRPEFRTATFDESIQEISDLQLGMSLEGVVTNVTNFGAFVDLGVHQDGLVHISQLSQTFVKDPHEVVKAGDIVTVRVLEVDAQRKRISLSMKPETAGEQTKNERQKPSRSTTKAPTQAEPSGLGAKLIAAGWNKASR